MFDFLRFRPLTFVLSLALVGGFFGFAAYRYQQTGSVFTLSVDFTGGTQIQLGFEKPITSEQIISIAEAGGWRGAKARDLSDNTILLRVIDFEGDVEGVAQRISHKIREALPDNPVIIKQTEQVGEGVGKELWWWSLVSIVIALVLMLGYIAFRFRSFSYAFGAVVALFHDAIAMLAIFLFFDREISLNVIGAILTVIGYSINDTIVIFSKIRDNLRGGRVKGTLSTVVNHSLNQTLKRTMLTSISTFLPVASMLFLGGEALKDFSIALLVGIVFGTYSSVYIASPIMMLFHTKD